MNNTEKIKIMTQMLEEIWLRSPELRFNQLIHHLQVEYNNIYNGNNTKKVYDKEEKNGLIVFAPESCVDLFHVEDSSFMEYLQLYLNATKEQEGEQ